MKGEKQPEEMCGEIPTNMVNFQSSFFAFYTAQKVCVVQYNKEEYIANLNTLETEALKSLHIIKHSPAPSRSSSPENEYHDSTELSSDQTKRVEDLLRSFRKPAGRGGGPSSPMKIKKENEPGSRKRIKREEEPESSKMAIKRRRAEKGKGKAVTIDLTADNSGDDQKFESSEMAAKRRRVAKGKGKAVMIDLTADSGGEDEEKFKVPNVVIGDEEPEVVRLIKDEDDVDGENDGLSVQNSDPRSKRPLWRGLGLF